METYRKSGNSASLLGVKTLLIVLSLMFVVVGQAEATHIGYATDTAEDLWLVNFTVGTANRIGNTGQFYESVALRDDGTLFGATSHGILYTISTSDGSSTLVGNTGLGNIEALDFNGSDLISVDYESTPSFYSLNQNNATATLIVTAQSATGLVRSGCILDSTSMLVRGDSPDNTLYDVDLGTGAVTAIGAMGVRIYGMDFLDSTLYGLRSGGQLFTINQGTGQTTQIGDVGDQYFLSLTTVPEPGTICLLGLGVLLLRRKKSA